MKIKAISLRQPYASLVACGIKTIETRKWMTKYRGPLLICAAKGAPWTGTGHDLGDVPRGVALCIVTLRDCRPMTEQDETFACCHVYTKAKSWFLSDRKPIKPFPVKGALSLFDVEIPDFALQGV